MTDRLKVRFHPSLPEHSQRLLATLDVDVVFDEAAPLECPCGCKRAGHRKGLRVTDEVARVDARALSERARQRLRAEVCPRHNEKWITVRGVRTCRACEREAVRASTGAA